MAGPHPAPLSDLQPSQLFVSRRKLAAVVAAWTDGLAASLPPVPVKRYGGRLVLTDGHTRALAAHRAGLDALLVVDDRDELDDEAYETCVRWCRDAGVLSVADLDDRVLDDEDYARRWLERCRSLHERLAVRRQSGGGRDP